MLKATKNKENDTAPQNNTESKTSTANGSIVNTPEKQEGHVNKKQRILEKITYDDLEDTDENKKKGATQLNLSKVRKYI